MKFFFSLIIITCVLFSTQFSSAQNTFPSTGSAGIGTSSPNVSALLEVKSTTQGVLFPRMTKGQRDAIPTPATGLIIYQTNSTTGYYFFDGTNWKQLSPQGVNKTLNNLSAPTALNSSLLPGTTGTIDIGSAALNWKDIYTGSVKFADGTTQTTASLANLSLSNLSATSINQPLIPSSGNSKDLGSSTLGWKDVYATGSIYLDGSKFMDNRGSRNIFIGKNAGNTASPGSSNVAIGNGALKSYTHGFCVAVGDSALANNKDDGSGDDNNNTAVGYAALASNTTGSGNTAFGYNALFANTTGSNNSAHGYRTLEFNTTGSANTANGNFALFENTTGDKNTAAGYHALHENTTGSDNTANGHQAIHNNITGSYNIANGNSALFSNVTGNYNIAHGYYALYENTTGSRNVANGSLALRENTTGSANIAEGHYSGYNNTTGSYNTFIGDSAGNTTTTGSNNIFIGYKARASNGSFTNMVVIGNDISLTASNSVMLGNGSTLMWGMGTIPGAGQAMKVGTSSSNGNGANLTTGGVWTNASSRNKKEGFVKLDANDVLQKINKLDIERWKYIGTNEYHIGPVAEEFYAQFETGIDDTTISTIDPGGVALLAIQALSAANDVKDEQIKSLQFTVGNLQSDNQQLESDITKMKNEIAAMKTLMQQFDQSLSECCLVAGTSAKDNINYKSVVSSPFVGGQAEADAPKLEQNIPNPFNETTRIRFYLPQIATTAVIKIYSLDGTEMKSFSISQKGYGEIFVSSNTLTSGVYVYTLIIDGKAIDTKQMILTK